jgi:hypothetical protein
MTHACHACSKYSDGRSYSHELIPADDDDDDARIADCRVRLLVPDRFPTVEERGGASLLCTRTEIGQ